MTERLAARHHEYMNPKLLDSQLATLEPPKDALRVVNDRTPNEVVSQILEQVSLRSGMVFRVSSLKVRREEADGASLV